MTLKTFPTFVLVNVSAPYNLYDSLNATLLKATVDFNAPEKINGKLKVKVSVKHSDVKISACVPEKVEYILRKK